MRLGDLIRVTTQFHENPRIQELATTPLGNTLLWVSVSALLLSSQYYPLIPLMLLAQFFPTKRIPIMGFGVGALFLHKKLLQLQVDDIGWFLLDAGLIVGMLYLFFRLANAYSALPRVVRNHPQLFLHALLWLCIVATAGLPSNVREDPSWEIVANLIVCLVFFAFLIWRIGFMLYSGKRGLIKQTRFIDHLIYCLPFMGYTQVPYGKGLDHMLPKLAKTTPDLARSQLAGLKLLLMALLWEYFLRLLDITLFTSTGSTPTLLLPPEYRLFHIDVLITISLDQMPPLPVVWSSLIVDMVYETTQLAITGHLIIGCLRLFGFYLFRNTYKPLLSTSLIDFWNRYYYYFKELLVDFFFFPTYLALFKNHPKLRIFAATMASAFLGNFYYHLLQHFDQFIISGLLLPFTPFSSYLFYTFVLAVAIFVSILREQGQRGKPAVVRTPLMAGLRILRRVAGVWLFIAVLRIWDHPRSELLQDTLFFFKIFGIDL